MRGRGRRFVVDADIGRGAADLRRAERGERMESRALAFARSLEALYDARHVAVLSPALKIEWRKHARRGSSGHRWLVRMVERNLVVQLSSEPDAVWLEDIIRRGLPEGDRQVALKDRHLVATATGEADDRLLSGDGKAREKYARLAQDEPNTGKLHWVDPAWSGVRSWLMARAPDDTRWTLGAGPTP